MARSRHRPRLVKISRQNQAEIQVVAFLFFAILWSVTSILVFIRLQQIPQEDTVTTFNRSAEEIVTQQRILDKLTLVPVYIFTNNEQLIRLPASFFTLPPELEKKLIVPFFYTQNEAREFQQLLQKQFTDNIENIKENIKIEPATLAFIYQERQGQPDSQYLLLQKQAKNWAYYSFEQIPVYNIVHKQQGHAFFVNVKVEDRETITIPYFLSQKEAEKRLRQQKLQAEWRIKIQPLSDLVDKIGTSSFGQNIIVIPEDINHKNNPG